MADETPLSSTANSSLDSLAEDIETPDLVPATSKLSASSSENSFSSSTSDLGESQVPTDITLTASPAILSAMSDEVYDIIPPPLKPAAPQTITLLDDLDDEDDDELIAAPQSFPDRKQDSLLSESATSHDGSDMIDYDLDVSIDKDGFDIGFSEDRNKRYRRTMEDTHTILRRFGNEPGSGYFAIFDGHAGKAAAEFVGNNLHDVLLDVQRESSSDRPVTDILGEAFVKMDEILCSTKGIYAGCTAVVALVRYEERVIPSTGEKSRVRVLYTANAGDARAVLSRPTGAVRLTYDHKGSDMQEARRVVESGAFVMNGRVNGVLAVTRSFGDVAMKEWIISAPYTTETVLSPEDDILILACDGLWDVCSDEDAVKLIKDEKDPQKSADALLNYALENMTTDNLSVLVVRLI